MVVMDTHHRQYLIALSNQDNSALKHTYKDVFGTSAPLAKKQGYNPKKLQNQLLKSLSRNQQPTKTPYLEGTRLFREWQGTTYEVSVLTKGFLFNNKNYRSLSKIAEEITGTRWSGPRFFGVVA